MAYFSFSLATFLIMNLLLQVPSVILENEYSSYLIILVEILILLIVRLFCPKIKAARMLSGILLFIGCLAIIFTSFGSGLLTNMAGIFICLILSISNLSYFLFVLLIPFTSPLLCIKTLLRFLELDTTTNIIKACSDNYMILFIYPAILLLCCHRK